MTKNTIKKVCNSIIISDNKELYKKSQEELEEYWLFEFDINKSDELNLYKFTKMIELYKSYCRRWEEHHNGCVCVVERVRDKYLMSKIKGFIDKLKHTKHL